MYTAASSGYGTTNTVEEAQNYFPYTISALRAHRYSSLSENGLRSLVSREQHLIPKAKSFEGIHVYFMSGVGKIWSLFFRFWSDLVWRPSSTILCSLPFYERRHMLFSSSFMIRMVSAFLSIPAKLTSSSAYCDLIPKSLQREDSSPRSFVSESLIKKTPETQWEIERKGKEERGSLSQ